MAEACGNCASLGGSCFDAVAVTANTQNRGSTGNTGRHGASNIWQKWPKTGQKGKQAGITARAPYNIGDPKTPKTLAGSTLHHVGLDLGPHGHGIGVVPAAIGGAHTKRSMIAVSSIRGRSGSRTIQGVTGVKGICFKCFGTWLAAGVIVALILVFKR
jgi:hypothetical protein